MLPSLLDCPQKRTAPHSHQTITKHTQDLRVQVSAALDVYANLERQVSCLSKVQGSSLYSNATLSTTGVLVLSTQAAAFQASLAREIAFRTALLEFCKAGRQLPVLMAASASSQCFVCYKKHCWESRSPELSLTHSLTQAHGATDHLTELLRGSLPDNPTTTHSDLLPHLRAASAPALLTPPHKHSPTNGLTLTPSPRPPAVTPPLHREEAAAPPLSFDFTQQPANNPFPASPYSFAPTPTRNLKLLAEQAMQKMLHPDTPVTRPHAPAAPLIFGDEEQAQHSAQDLHLMI